MFHQNTLSMFREFDEFLEIRGYKGIITPAHNCIIVRPNVEEKDVEGFLVKGTQEIVSGNVVSVGGGVLAEVVEGDLLFFVRSSCLQFKHDGEDFIVVPDTSVRAWQNFSTD